MHDTSDVSLCRVATLASALRAFGAFSFLGVLASGASASCAGQSPARNDCATQAWSGTCTLRALTKVEDRELPIPYVVYEGIYTPQVNPQFPNYTPAEVRQRFGTPAQHEFELQDYLNAQKSVTCQSPVAQGSCIPEGLTVNVPPFDPDHAPSLSLIHI